jgi:hypothetical protein
MSFDYYMDSCKKGDFLKLYAVNATEESTELLLWSTGDTNLQLDAVQEGERAQSSRASKLASEEQQMLEEEKLREAEKEQGGKDKGKKKDSFTDKLTKKVLDNIQVT